MNILNIEIDQQLFHVVAHRNILMLVNKTDDNSSLTHSINK